jgi:hypothetical protein
MKVNIERTEPATGGQHRTPRDRIEPVFNEHTGDVEPDARLDMSSSESWEGSSSPQPGAPTTWQVQTEAFRQFVAAAESLDSQAAAEQAGGSDEKGGIYSAGFNHDLVVIGKGDDDGDLNTSNIDRKLAAIKVTDENGRSVPIPYGGTAVMPTNRYLDQHYLGEFEKDEDTGNLVPVGQRPIRACTLWTDGAMTDYREFGQRLLEDHTSEWPAEHWFIAIFGYGDGHDKALNLYRQIAEKHPNVHVYSFEGVTNPAEVAEDMAVAVLGRKAA